MQRKEIASVAFESTAKETIQDRIKQLFNGRNMRQVAREWGLPYSTLNNYFEKGATPGLNVVANICQKENVTLDWLVFGIESAPINEDEKKDEKIKYAWDTIYDSLTDKELIEFLKIIHMKGIRSIIQNYRENEAKDIESIIDSLDIRFTLKQAIKEAMKGDEHLDREILRRIEENENINETGQLSQEENHQKVG